MSEQVVDHHLHRDIPVTLHLDSVLLCASTVGMLLHHKMELLNYFVFLRRLSMHTYMKLIHSYLGEFQARILVHFHTQQW